MLSDLLKFDKIGTKEELLFLLFDDIWGREELLIADLKKYCISNVFSFTRTFDGILLLLNFIEFVSINGKEIKVNAQMFPYTRFAKEGYFETYHFYESLFHALKNHDVLVTFFNSETVKYDAPKEQFYIVENKVPFRYFQIKNFLLAVGFFERDIQYENCLFVGQIFGREFSSQVILEIRSSSDLLKKLSLQRLKLSLEIKEEVGRKAEEFVLIKERERLSKHFDLEKVRRISDEFVNAGYDIESYSSLDSIVIDKFIEVKSFSQSIAFYWSRNEISKAEELGDKYYLVLVDRNNIDNPVYQPKWFQNPFRIVFQSDFWQKEVETWKISFDPEI